MNALQKHTGERRSIGCRATPAVLAENVRKRYVGSFGAEDRDQDIACVGGAQVIPATAPSSKAMSELFEGLAPNGKLLVIGVAFDPIQVSPVQFITGSRNIQGWVSGTAADEEDTVRFAELSGVRPMIETYPFEKAAEAYARMRSGKARFRVVLTM